MTNTFRFKAERGRFPYNTHDMESSAIYTLPCRRGKMQKRARLLVQREVLGELLQDGHERI